MRAGQFICELDVLDGLDSKCSVRDVKMVRLDQTSFLMMEVYPAFVDMRCGALIRSSYD